MMSKMHKYREIENDLGEVHFHKRNLKELTEKHFQAWILRFNLIQLSLVTIIDQSCGIGK